MESRSSIAELLPEDQVLDERHAEWIRDMAAGQEKALEALYESTLRRVYAVAIRILRDESRAEDVVTDVYYQAWSEAGRYTRARGRPLTWLLTICRSRALDVLRHESSQQRKVGAALALATDDSSDGPDELLQSVETGSLVHSLLTTLSPVQRHVLALAYFREFSHQQIATYLELPLGTVKGHIRKALTVLQSAARSNSPGRELPEPT